MLIVKLKRLIFYTVVRFVWFLKVRPVSKSQSYCYFSSEILTFFFSIMSEFGTSWRQSRRYLLLIRRSLFLVRLSLCRWVEQGWLEGF